MSIHRAHGALLAGFLIVAVPVVASGEQSAEVAACQTFAAVKAAGTGSMSPSASPRTESGPPYGTSQPPLTPGQRERVSPPASGGLQAPGTGTVGSTDPRYRQAFDECLQKLQR
jgi:hypothetical protein